MKLSRLTGNSLPAGLFWVLFFWSGARSNLFAYEVVPVTHGGELFGAITFKGDAPPNPTDPVLRNPDFCGATIQEETYLISRENHGLENVVIHIENIRSGKKPLESTVVIEDRHCHIIPHVQGGMVGGSYEIRNSDPVLHNPNLRLEGTTLVNVAMPAGGKNIKKTFSQGGIVDVKCNAHQFMQGWVFVADNPYYAVTDAEGNYRIFGIPAGRYKIKVWHEGLPGREIEVTIYPDKKTELSLELTR